MSRIPHRIEKDGVTRGMKPETDQPCGIIVCRYNNRRGCTKKMANGTQTTGFGTYTCPGFAKVRIDPDAHRDIHLDHMNRKPKRILKGKQAELELKQ